jgi:beta-lactamase class A
MSDLQQRLAEIEAGFDGELSLAAMHMGTRERLLWHADRKCPTASVIKLPILIHTLLLAREGRVSLDETVTLRDADKKPGSGILTQLSDGLTLPLRDACMLMMAISDNTATNLVLDRVTIDGVNARMAELGCARTKLFRKVYSDGPPICAENARYGLGVTTPRDMLRLLGMIYDGQIGDAATSRLVRRFLAAQHYRDGIPRLLGPDWTYEGKTGAVDAVRNDVGFVTRGDDTIALAVFCSRMPVPLWTSDNPGLLTIARVARVIAEVFSERPTVSQRSGPTP